MVLTKRIIPCLDVANGRVVKGLNFESIKDAGDPVQLAEKYSNEGADEPVFLDITASSEQRETIKSLVKKIAQVIDIPFTVGGGVKSLQHARDILLNGADKVAINTGAVKNPEVITELMELFGKQCVVVAIDSRRNYNIENVKKFGLPVAVAVNHFIKDTDSEVKALIDFCNGLGVKASLCTHWANGGEGTKDLAAHVAELCEKDEAKFKFLYESKTPLFKKIETIAKEIYRADEVIADTKIREQLKNFEAAGYGDLPICVAKTQYSFSTDPNLKGAPSGHALPLREVRLSSGAEFIVVICGAIMTMPGLPRVPAADSIKLNKKGEIEGLF